MLLFLALLVRTTTVRAEERRIGVASSEPLLQSAVEAQLVQRGATVVAVDGVPTATTALEMTEQASRITRERGLAALVWVARGALCVFDTAAGELSVRPLSSLTLDEAGAAAAALSVRVILRDAPFAHREPETPPAGAVPPPAVVPTPGIPARPSPAPRRTESPLPVWFLFDGGARVWTGVRAPEAWAGTGVSLWPAAWHERIGAEIAGRAGFGVGIDHPDFNGRAMHDTAVAFVLARFDFASWGAAELGPGFSVDAVSLSGTVARSDQHVQVARVNPGAAGRLAVDARLGRRLRLAILFEAGYLFRSQQYFVDATRVFEQPALTLDLGARVSVEVN